MGLFDILHNVRYAFTGKKPDRSDEWMKLAQDIAFPSELHPRDKHTYKDAAYFRHAIQHTLGYTRYSLAQDRASGDKAVYRAYVNGIAHGYVEFLEIAYTGGLDLGDIARTVPEMLDGLAYADPVYRAVINTGEHNHVLDLATNYFMAFPALAMFIGLRRSTAEIMQLLHYTGDGGRDQLFDRVAQRFDPDRKIGDRCVISPHHRLLISAMDAPPPERAALVKKFLDGWSKKVLKHSASYDTHEGDGYSGYWSWEAAAVVMLWDIDDSTFRDHPNYPDELVASYRRAGG